MNFARNKVVLIIKIGDFRISNCFDGNHVQKRSSKIGM